MPNINVHNTYWPTGFQCRPISMCRRVASNAERPMHRTARHSLNREPLSIKATSEALNVHNRSRRLVLTNGARCR